MPDGDVGESSRTLSRLPDLTVVIPTYRRYHTLGRALDRLDRQTVSASSFEVNVVVDSRDDPDRVATIVRANARPYRVNQLQAVAPGASAARNVGWVAAAAPLVLFLDDDILAMPELLGEHLTWHRREPAEAVAVLGHVRWAREVRVNPFMRWLEEGTQFDYGALTGGEATWTHFYTANVSVRRSLLKRVGGLDEERFPFGYEDLDLGWRLAQQGMRLLYNANALAEHLHQTTIEQWRPRLGRIAHSERRWVALHPELPPWFHDRFAAAAARPRIPAAVGRLAARVPRRLPVLGPGSAALADLYFRQQLAPEFLTAWNEPDDQSSTASSAGS